MSDRPNALFTPSEVVVDAMMLTEGRNREGIVRCSSGRRLSSVWSVKKFLTADRPGVPARNGKDVRPDLIHGGRNRMGSSSDFADLAQEPGKYH